MKTITRNYILATVVIIAISLLFIAMTLKPIDMIIPIVCVLFYPCIIMGLYMFMEAGGSDYINGMGIESLPPEAKRNATSYIGLYMVISMILCEISIMLIMYVRWYIWVAVMVIAIIICFVPYLRKSRIISHPFKERSNAVKVCAFAIVSIVCIVPPLVLTNIEGTAGEIEIEFLDDQLHIKAPMVNKYLDYSDIDYAEIDPDFDKGSRIAGYATPSIRSGTYRNAEFGSYTLASYTKVDTCVFLQYHGDYYAFNQSSDEATQEAYEMLKSKLSP